MAPVKRLRDESVARAHLLAAALMPAEPHIRSSFTERLAPQSLYFGISQPLFATARPPGSNAADQASWNRDNDSAFPDASDWLRDSTRRNLAMGDISPEGDEQFAGERYD